MNKKSVNGQDLKNWWNISPINEDRVLLPHKQEIFITAVPEGKK